MAISRLWQSKKLRHLKKRVPIDSEIFQKGNNDDKARLDVSARGLWSTFEKIFVDVRIFNLNSESYKYKLQTLAKLYAEHSAYMRTRNKIRHYLNRILQVEKGTFSPGTNNGTITIPKNMLKI